MSTAYTAPFFQQQYLGSDGLPIAGGHINFYAAGSTVRKAIWLDRTHQNEAPNPLPLDSAGVPTKQYFLDDGLYDIAIYSAAGVLIHTLYNIETSGGGSGTATDAGMKRYYTWFVMDSTYPLPTADNLTKISALDIETMLEFGYGCTGNTQTTSTTSTSIWYVEAWDGTTVKWSETVIDISSEIINLDRGNCNTLDPHPNRSISDEQIFATYPAGLYNLVPVGDGFYWKPLVVKEIPDPTYTATGALVYDATTHIYRWAPFDELGGKVKVTDTDSTAGHLEEKVVAGTDSAGDATIILGVQGAANTNQELTIRVDTDKVYEKILDKLNPPGYDLFGSYPANIGVSQLTGQGAGLVASPCTLQFPTSDWYGNNGGRGIGAGYHYVTVNGTQVHKRCWLAQAENGNVYLSDDNWSTYIEDDKLKNSFQYNPYGTTTLVYGRERWNCIRYSYVGGTIASYCWIAGGSSTNAYVYPDKPENWNADGTMAAYWIQMPYGSQVSNPSNFGDAATHNKVCCFVGNDSQIGRTTDFVTFTNVKDANGNNIVATHSPFGGIDTDRYGNWIAIERDTGVLWLSEAPSTVTTSNDGLVWKRLTGLTIYASDGTKYTNQTALRNPYGESFGNMASAYGLWVAAVYSGGTGHYNYVYSDDMVTWYEYTDTSALSNAVFYSAAFDGVRWFGTNTAANTSPALYQLLVSAIPAHRELVCEKGIAISTNAFLTDMPNAGILSTDENGKLVASSGPNPSGGAYVPSMDPASATQVLMPSIVGTAIEVLTLVSPRTDVTITTATTLNISTIKGGTGSLYLTIRDSNYNLIAVTAAVTNPTANDKLILPLASIYKPLTQESVSAYTLTSGTQYYIGLWTSVSGATYLGSTCSVLTAAVPHPGHIFTSLSAVTPTLSGGSESQMRIYCAIEQD